MPYLLYEKTPKRGAKRVYARLVGGNFYCWTMNRGEAQTWDDKAEALAAREQLAAAIRIRCGAKCGAVLHIQPTTGGSCWIIGPLAV